MSLKVAILGYAGQGHSAYDYWNRDGNELTICDQTADIGVPAGAKTQLGPDYLKDLDQFDLLIRTPALHPNDIVAANPDTPDILGKVTTVTNEFLKVCPTKNVIGVTGTKGKGTTSTLIAQMLEADGKHTHLGGNIGLAPLELLKGVGAVQSTDEQSTELHITHNENAPSQDTTPPSIRPDDWVVLELANFQLIDLKLSPTIAVCLMVEPEHLDWHNAMEEYLTTKQQLFAHQTTNDTAIYYGLNDYSQHIAGVSPGRKIPYMKHPGADVINNEIVIDGQVICNVSELKLIGKHNWQNVCAAVTTVWQITQNMEALRSVLTSFGGLPHRLELVRELNGAQYYNDSFASAASATIAALEAISAPKVMIIGGYERGLPLEELAQAIKNHAEDIRKVLLIGTTANRVAENLKEQRFENFEVLGNQTMPEIVSAAAKLAQPGDAVILSPGFASFDMFKNFEDRGLQFKASVEQL